MHSQWGTLWRVRVLAGRWQHAGVADKANKGGKGRCVLWRPSWFIPDSTHTGCRPSPHTPTQLQPLLCPPAHPSPPHPTAPPYIKQGTYIKQVRPLLQFLPYTHTADAHLLWNAAGKSERMKERFISLQPAMQSALATGDTAVFDSRLLHCGCANESQKPRALFYVTFSRDAEWPLPDGLHGSNSIRAEDLRRWTLPKLLALREGDGADSASV